MIEDEIMNTPCRVIVVGLFNVRTVKWFMTTLNTRAFMLSRWPPGPLYPKTDQWFHLPSPRIWKNDSGYLSCLWRGNRISVGKSSRTMLPVTRRFPSGSARLQNCDPRLLHGTSSRWNVNRLNMEAFCENIRNMDLCSSSVGRPFILQHRSH